MQFLRQLVETDLEVLWDHDDDFCASSAELALCRLQADSATGALIKRGLLARLTGFNSEGSNGTILTAAWRDNEVLKYSSSFPRWTHA